MSEAAESGLNVWIWWPALRGGWDPVEIGTRWSTWDTVLAVRALVFGSVLEWAGSPPPPPKAK
jgi:hypothetical protein